MLSEGSYITVNKTTCPQDFVVMYDLSGQHPSSHATCPPLLERREINEAATRLVMTHPAH